MAATQKNLKKRRTPPAGNIKSIALEAGCSPSTVSRVVNGVYEGFSVRKELEEKILGIAKRLDYKPNPYLRAMRAKRTKLVAILDMPYNFLGVNTQAKMKFIEDIRKAGLTESLKYVERDCPEEHKVGFPVDAALLFDVCEQDTLAYFETNKIPYVVVNGVCGPNGLSVMVDESVGVSQILEHLVGLGHTRVAYANQTGFHKRKPTHYSVPQREAGYLKFMERHGLKPCRNFSNQAITARDFLKASLEDGDTAILCYHERKLLEIMHEAWKLGVSIPSDLSVACFNDDTILSLLNPPVTCMAIPGKEMGTAAAEAILKVLNGEMSFSGQTYSFPGRLIERESSASPKKAGGRR